MNPNDYKVRISNVSVSDVSATKTSSNAPNPGCNRNTADLSATLAAPLVIAQASTASNQQFGAIKMGVNAAPECAGSAITATLTFAGELVAN